MARNYGAALGLGAALQLAKRDVWLLSREIERMVREENGEGIQAEEEETTAGPVAEPAEGQGP
jgi:hypothetical protein